MSNRNNCGYLKLIGKTIEQDGSNLYVFSFNNEIFTLPLNNSIELVKSISYHYRNCRVSKYGISLNPNEGHVSIIDNRIKI